MIFYRENIEDVISELHSTRQGLMGTEAAKRLAENGKNKLIEMKKKSLLARFFSQFANLMIIVLLAAAAVSFVVSLIEHESFTDVFVILFVVILNALLGTIQEAKAEEAIDALKQMNAPTAKVVRDGKLEIILSEDVVVGDVIVIEAGDQIVADARLIEVASLKVEEAALTGESVAEDKHTSPIIQEGNVALGDRRNMVYMGGVCAYGRGKAIVTATGMDTEMGKIAGIIANAKEEQTPLQIKLNQLSKYLAFIVLGICLVMFIVGVLEAGEFSLDVVLNTFMLAISLAVAAIPEGLAAVVTIVLSMGVTKMAKNNAVVRRLTAVETLGCTQIICSDKTGTLTQNKMTVVDYYGVDEKLLAKGMAMCSDSKLDDNNIAIGEATENALVNYAYVKGFNKNKLDEEEKRVAEAPFDSNRKLMSTVHLVNGSYVQYTKGALDELLAICTNILTKDGIRPITEEDVTTIKAHNKQMASKALRVLGLAYTTYEKEFDDDNLEHDLTFVGFVGMKDPIRPEVVDAIKKCQAAGIRVVMITGDHLDTASAIAMELGIISNPSQAVVGSYLDNFTDEELRTEVPKFSVFVRVQPEHKVRIVNTWKSLDKVTAMTGDGVNDAPSIKVADIGIGMGITGTDVTKNVADMILADDNFATIVKAVEEGRKIYSNIKKSIMFLLSSNMSEVISIFFSTIVGFTILKPVHILWINLITDTLPALALGIGEEEKDSMHTPPRPKSEGLFANGAVYDIVFFSLVVSALTIVAYMIGAYLQNGVFGFSASTTGMTMAFLTMSLAEVFHTFNARSAKDSIFRIQSQNKLIWFTTLISIALTALVLFVPFIRDIFGFDAIGLKEYGIAFGLSLAVIVLGEVYKLIKRAIKK